MLPLLQARIAGIWSILAEFVAEITVLRVDYHAFKLKLTLADGSTIRISEQYYRPVTTPPLTLPELQDFHLAG